MAEVKTKRIPVIDEVVNEIERIVEYGRYPLCVYFQRYMEYRKKLIEMKDLESVNYYDGKISELTKELNYTEIDFKY